MRKRFLFVFNALLVQKGHIDDKHFAFGILQVYDYGLR